MNIQERTDNKRITEMCNELCYGRKERDVENEKRKRLYNIQDFKQGVDGKKECDVENEKRIELCNVRDLKQCVDGNIDHHWQTECARNLDRNITESETLRKYQPLQSSNVDDLCADYTEKGSLDKQMSEKCMHIDIQAKGIYGREKPAVECSEVDSSVSTGLSYTGLSYREPVVILEELDHSEVSIVKELDCEYVLNSKCVLSKEIERVETNKELIDEYMIETSKAWNPLLVSPHQGNSFQLLFTFHPWTSLQCFVSSPSYNSGQTSAICINNYFQLVTGRQDGIDRGWKVASHVPAHSSRVTGRQDGIDRGWKVASHVPAHSSQVTGRQDGIDRGWKVAHSSRELNLFSL